MTDINPEKVWRAVLEAIKLSVSPGTYATYLATTFPVSLTSDSGKYILEVACPSTFIRNTIEQRYLGQLLLEMKAVLETPGEIKLVVTEKKSANTEENLPLFDSVKFRPEVAAKANLRTDYTFENYAVSGSNQMAFAAAQAVARKPGENYNPLFIYGGVGVGKTHLMQAVGHEIIKSNKGPVLFCSGEEFTNDLVEAIRFKTTDKVRAKYRKVKALLIDDVQFIAGKPTIQEEFFHTYNAVNRDGGQVIMTSDRPPAEITKLEERLRSRFGAGLIVDIGPADFELRTAILLIKSRQKGYELPMNVAQLIAENIEGVRELQGFLSKLESYVQLHGDTLDIPTAEKLLKLDHKNKTETKIVTPGDFVAGVADYFKVGAQLLKGERRTKTIAWPRQVLMYLLRQELKLPFEEVGRLVGGRDHSTVMHAYSKIDLLVRDDEKMREEIGLIVKKVLSFA